MIKVEGNLVYNTSKAKFIAEWNNGKNSSDFGYRCKELYRTERGNWFMYDYSYYIKNPNCIEGILPLGAREFLCEISDINAIEEYFPGYLEEA